VFRTVIITGAISMVILAVMFVLRHIASATLGTEYIEFALALGLFLVLIAGSYWFVVLGQGRRT
jgi:presenilin-like A22 family membrane protease